MLLAGTFYDYRYNIHELALTAMTKAGMSSP